jgi:esterase/lipase
MPIQQKIIQNLQPTGLNSKFDYGNLNFAAYISAVQNMQRVVSEDQKLDLTETQLNNIAPFEIRPAQPNRKGILLIHGLFDTPIIMRDIGEYYAEKGFLVRCILLPGHGTIPADLLTTSPTEWLKATEYGIKSFRNEVDEIYLAGFSTGAILALNYAIQSENSEPCIDGLIMLSPVFAINTAKTIFVRVYRMFRWLFKEHKWIFRHECPDYAKYTSFPVNSGYLVQRLIVETKLLLQKYPCTLPVFIAMSRDDETVRASAALDFFAKVANKKNQFILYSNNVEDRIASNITVLKSAKPDENILNFSHVSLPVSPNNSHYGRTGDHQEPLHEPKNSPEDTLIHRGALTPENENNYRIRRLTYNPFFEDLMAEIDQFITATSTS